MLMAFIVSMTALNLVEYHRVDQIITLIASRNIVRYLDPKLHLTMVQTRRGWHGAVQIVGRFCSTICQPVRWDGTRPDISAILFKRGWVVKQFSICFNCTSFCNTCRGRSSMQYAQRCYQSAQRSRSYTFARGQSIERCCWSSCAVGKAGLL